MRIGVDIRSLLSPTGRGVSHYTVSLLSELMEAHPEDSWHLIQTGRRASLLPEELAKNAAFKHVRWPNKLVNASLITCGRPRLDAALGGVDVFFAPNLGFFGLQRRTPLVLTVHDLSFKVYPAWFTARERAWQQAVRPGRLLRRADRVIAVSEQTKAEIVHYYEVDPEQVTVIHSGIDDVYHRPIPEADRRRVRQKYGLPASYVLFIGAVEPRKNVSTLLAAYQEAREHGLKAELVVAGSISPAMERTIAATSEPIHSLGYVDEADKPALYAEAQTFTLLSHHEGFGFPPLEALAAGTPSIVAALPVFQETLGAAAVMVPAEDVRAVAANLVELERNRQAREHLVKNGEPVMKRLTWQEAARHTYAVLQAAAGDTDA